MLTQAIFDCDFFYIVNMAEPMRMWDLLYGASVDVPSGISLVQLSQL